MTSNDLATSDAKTESTLKRAFNRRNKNNLKAGSVQGNFEINDKYLFESIRTNNI